jgi:hypothetical protein
MDVEYDGYNNSITNSFNSGWGVQNKTLCSSNVSSGWGWHTNSLSLFSNSNLMLSQIKQYEANQIKWKQLADWSLQFHSKLGFIKKQ